MKKLLLIALLFLVACQPAPTPLPVITAIPKPTKVPGEYVVTKSTFLYFDPDIDSKYIRELPEGTIVVPVDGGTELDCISLEEVDTVYVLCEVIDQKSGIKGWILKKWIN